MIHNMGYRICTTPEEKAKCDADDAAAAINKKTWDSVTKLQQEYVTKQQAEKQHKSEVQALELIGGFFILALLFSVIYKNMTQPKNKYNPKIIFLIWVLAFIVPPLISSYFVHKGVFEFTTNTALALSAISKIGLFITLIWVSVKNKISWYLSVGLLLITYFFSFGIWIAVGLVLLINKKKKYCEKCKKFYSSDSEFCEECGEKLASGEKFCEKCDKAYSFDKSHCAECGSKLKIKK